MLGYCLATLVLYAACLLTINGLGFVYKIFTERDLDKLSEYADNLEVSAALFVIAVLVNLFVASVETIWFS